MLPLEELAMAEHTTGGETTGGIGLLLLERTVVDLGSPFHLIEELVLGEEAGLTARRVTVMLVELLGEVFLDGTATPTVGDSVRGLGKEGVGTPVHHVRAHPAVTVETDGKAGPGSLGESRIVDVVGLEDLLSVAVAGHVEVRPVLITGDELVLTGVDQVTQILAGHVGLVVEHGGLAGDELGEAQVHAAGVVLVGGAGAHRKLTGSDGLFALGDDPVEDLFLGLVVDRELVTFVDAVQERRLIPDRGGHEMKVRAHDAGLGHALLRDGARPLGLGAVAVLRGEVGNHQVGVIDGVAVALVELLDGAAGGVILELVEHTEIVVVIEGLTGGEDVVGGVIQVGLLRVVDTRGTAHLVDVLGVHVVQGSLGILVGRIEFDGADNALLGDLKILLAGNGEESES